MDYGGLCKEQRIHSLRDSSWGWESRGLWSGGGKKEVTRWDWGMQNRGCGDWITHPIVYSISSMTKQSRAHWLSCVICSSRQNTFLLPGQLRRTSQFLLFFTTFWPAPPWSSFSMIWFLGENECRFPVNLTNASQKQQRPEVYSQFSEPWGFSE